MCDRQNGRCSCPAGWMGSCCETGKNHHSASEVIIMSALKTDHKEEYLFWEEITYIYFHSVCFDQHVLKVYTVQAVNSSARAIITPHVTTSLAPASVLQAGEGCTARKVIYPMSILFAPCWYIQSTVTHLCSFRLFTWFIWEAMRSAMPLSSWHFL